MKRTFKVYSLTINSLLLLINEITIHSSYFQINQIKFIDDIIEVMQLNQIDWNSSDFLKTRIFTHILCYSLNQNSVNHFNLM